MCHCPQLLLLLLAPPQWQDCFEGNRPPQEERPCDLDEKLYALLSPAHSGGHILRLVTVIGTLGTSSMAYGRSLAGPCLRGSHGFLSARFLAVRPARLCTPELWTHFLRLP